MQPPVVLSIAGSDSGGGAGIQADIRALNARQVFATTAITAITAQNTTSVSAIELLSEDIVRAQIEAVLTDLRPRAVKTGMLGQVSTVRLVAELASDGRFPFLVVDPVLVTTTGFSLMDSNGAKIIRDELLPHCDLITPNIEEAQALLGTTVSVGSVSDLEELAIALLELGPQAVLVKGGHAHEALPHNSPDILLTKSSKVVIDGPRIETGNDHGTGCSLASLIAAGIALGEPLHQAVTTAKAVVASSMRSSAEWHLGLGRGPLDILGWNQ
jgi:hydroxymethylpyrimidine kinase/phosphomethylpyrimidine kinase